MLWSIVILIAANAATIAAMLLVRRRAPEGSYFTDGDRASGVFGVLAGGFAIFAGFIIFLAFTTYDQSRSGGEAEALTVVQQFETAEFLPPAMHDRLAGELVCYGRSVVHQEWPQMEDGKGGDTINPWAVALFRSLKLANPTSASEQAAYAKWLDQTSDREEARSDRLHGAEGIIPTSIWLVLFLIAGVVFAFMLFFADSGEGAASQAMLMGSATTVIVLTLLAINALDNPYRRGLGQIKPVAMERSLRILDSARAVVNDTAPLPCDARGAPGVVLMEDASRAASTATSSSRRPCCSRWRRSRPPGRPTSRRAGTASRREAQSASIAARVESTRAANVANRQAQIDVALFTQWVDAYARDETELADFYRKRFRAEFQPAFEAWVATKPRTNPDAPLSPFAMPQYKLAATAQADAPRGAGRRVLAARRGASSSAPTTTRSPSCCSPRRCSSRASAPGCARRRRGWSSSGSATPCSSAA